MLRKKEVAYINPTPYPLQLLEFNYSDFGSFCKINEYLDFEELCMISFEGDQKDCQLSDQMSLHQWINCNELNWITEGALQHSFAVYCFLVTLMAKILLRKWKFR
ncbi:MAG: hypothetical protein JSS07_09015 [Proteobacteria bacterium]|nr:hypothetical protein [Pseudomonadota bacterium]